MRRRGSPGKRGLAAVVGLAALALAVLPACSDPARDRFERAEKAFLEQRMDEALAGFRSIPKEFPQSRFAPAALLRQGDLYGSFYRNDRAALEAYDALAYNYPQATELPRALLRKAEIRLLRFFDYGAAAEDLELLRTRFPRFDGTDEALVLLAKAYGGVGDASRQLAVLLELIDNYPNSTRVTEARWMAAYALLSQGRWAEAGREFRKIRYLATDPREAVRARWGMAQALEGEGAFAEALREYEAVAPEWDDRPYVDGKIARLKELLSKR